MASLMDYYRHVVNVWYGGSSRKFIEYAVSAIEKEFGRKNVFVLEAPTGYGKSAFSAAFSLYSVYEEFKSIVAFPLRALLEDQYSKFLKVFPRELIGRRYMHTAESPYLTFPVTLTTIDTLSLTVFGIAPEDLNKVLTKISSYGTSYGSMGHYWYSWASVGLSNIVLDEAHLVADTTKSLNFLVALMDFVVRHDGKLVLMSATLPKALKDALLKNSKLYGKMEFINFEPGSEGYDEEFVEERRKKKYHPINVVPLRSEEKLERIESWILENKDKYDKVITVFNTVGDAIEFYNKIISNRDFEEFRKILLHSRFTEEDRKSKIDKLRKIVKEEKYIVVATQTIEAGVDISSTLMISEAAPANSLVQRFGRFLRYGEVEGKAYVWYEVDDEGKLKAREISGEKYYKVYNYELTDKTIEYIRKHSNMNFHVPQDYSELLNAVYTSFTVNHEDVERMINIFLSYERGSERAAEEFLRLEGSFVRESLIIPAYPVDVLKRESIDDIVVTNIKVFNNRVVPVQYGFLKKYFSGIVVVELDGELRIVKVENPDEVFRSPRSFLRYYYGFKHGSIMAFVVDAVYDSVLGLIPLPKSGGGA